MDNNVFVKEKHYAAFIDTYTRPAELGLTGLECYRLQGGVVHRANAAGHPFFGVDQVIITTPENSMHLTGTMSNPRGPTSLLLVLEQFCVVMTNAVQKWHADHREHPNVKQNISNLLHWRPNGMPPYVFGGPVIASGPVIQKIKPKHIIEVNP
jgi:hypothetical protein